MDKIKNMGLFLSITVSILYVFFGFTAHCEAGMAPRGKVVVVTRMPFNMKGADCLTAKSSIGEPLNNVLNDGLLRKKPDGKLYPALAKSWEIDPNWAYMKFTLDEKAKWGDGSPVTAADVKFTIDRGMEKNRPWIIGGELRRNVKNVEIVDNYNFIIHLKKPYPGFLDRCNRYIGVQPKTYFEKIGEEKICFSTHGSRFF